MSTSVSTLDALAIRAPHATLAALVLHLPWFLCLALPRALLPSQHRSDMSLLWFRIWPCHGFCCGLTMAPAMAGPCLPFVPLSHTSLSWPHPHCQSATISSRCQSVPDCPCFSTTDFGNESCRNKNRVVLHVVAHMYNEGVVSGLAYHCYVIAPALQPISAIVAQAFHRLEPECYRNGLLQHIAPLTHPFASSVVASATQFCGHSLAHA